MDKIKHYRTISYYHRIKIALSQLDGIEIDEDMTFTKSKMDTVIKNLKDLDSEISNKLGMELYTLSKNDG